MNRFTVESFVPAYLQERHRRRLRDRARVVIEALRCCQVCPRHCEVDRVAGELGFCRTGRFVRVASAFAHFGEEVCLRGWNGSGTIFFAGCNLGCVFCQNWDLSHGHEGEACSAEAIAHIMIALQEKGCHNINLVTPSHVVPQIIETLALAVERGLRIPIVYNSGAYDSPESIRLLDGLVDIYMPDFKLWSPEHCGLYLTAPDYGERACAAIAEMHRQVGDLKFTPEGLACRGLLVRHLVMPGLLEESRRVFEWLGGLSRDTFVNIMGQYRPEGFVRHGGRQERFAAINRRPTQEEIRTAFVFARQAGLWRFDSEMG
ncbi:MAG TPA: radical SAM protein [Phycisphaerae bacterium]|jgi:putative pyruvate formate lyase activating enzyme|nr:radical SAM protein [Phycisphaerae bacterium]HOB76543.1 radical SAM protein [Phycisphaerae bacterium]HOJ56562.1 radical SAM protein [Phycisphaerae bacterium]HOL28352.1 radical SAM protein [Phycisphaerae bacterium]HPP19938.1 radical SAM protein [Phycisphaerae bacterium]